MNRRSTGGHKQKNNHALILPSTRAGAKDRQYVTALARGIEILQCFSPSEPELGTVEIAAKVRLPQPTVWRLCYTLMKKGILTYSALTKKLRLGVPVLGLGYAVVASQQIAEIARPYMQAIADRFQGSVTLGAPDGLSMIYLQRCESTSAVLINNHVGSRVPIGYSAMGWGYLASLAPEAREDKLKEIRAAEGSPWIQTERRLKAALKSYSREGYIVNKGSLHHQINGAAVPIQFRDTDTLLCLSSSGIDSVFTDEKLRQLGVSLIELASMLQSVPPRQRTVNRPSYT
ncbi:MAG: IclR family transcriptional regulator [Candidatus Acidiferrales bacterium]